MFGSFKSYLKDMWSFSEVPKDFLDIIILEGKNELLRGSWLEYIEFNEQRLWSMLE